MTIVIDLAQARIKKLEATPNNLNEFLERAKELMSEASKNKNSDIITIIKNTNDLKRKIEGAITKKIINAEMIDKGLFLCGIYVPQIFIEYLFSPPESWIAVDYRLKADKKEDAFTFKQGGDVCFLICSIFTERGEWKIMNPSYYYEMGKSFYYQFYTSKNKEIGYYMSDHFETIVDLTKKCFRSI